MFGRSPKRALRAGYTLLEATIAVALTTLLLSAAVLAARGGMGAFRSTQDTSDAEARVRRALDRVVFELLGTSVGELLPDPDGDFGTGDLQFRRAVGLVGTAPVWGTTQSLTFELAPGELNDGLDNDGNGLVDDGVIVLTRDVGGDPHRVILCRGVRGLLEGEIADGADNNGNGIIDEAGFNVHRVGAVLFVRISVEEPTELGSVIRTLETSVRPRN